MDIRRGFAPAGGGWVHYRTGGAGPPVLLIHQSPQDSRAMLGIARRLLDGCTVFAPDTPHFGLSDNLPEPATIGAFADRLAAFCEALGIGPAAVVGVHTGALIAVEFALRHPDRAATVIADGYGLFTDAERAAILDGYLPPNPPRPDGSHLVWLWQRLRDQLIFFPWHVQRRAHRLRYTVRDPDALHRAAMEILPRGDDYIAGYRAPFVYRRGEALKGLTRPVCFLYRLDDVLAGHRHRLPELPEQCSVETFDGDREATDAFIAGRVRRWAAEAAAHVPPEAPAAATPDRAMLGDPGAQIHARCSGEGPPLLLLHDLGRSGGALASEAQELAHRWRVWQADLPGHGASDPVSPAWTLERAARQLAQALPDPGEPWTVAAFGHAGRLATIWARLGAQRLAALHLVGPVELDQATCDQWRPHFVRPIVPEEAGAHLVKLWQRVRDGRLFRPFFLAEAAGVIDGEPDLDPESLHGEVVEALLCGDQWPRIWEAALAGPLEPATDAATTVHRSSAALRERLLGRGSRPG